MPSAGRRRRHQAEGDAATAAAWLQQQRLALSSDQPCLLPYLQYGPNNQFLQLMEAAVAAKALGRALLLPDFHAWTGDETSSRGTVVPFHETFDRESVQKYVPTATLPPEDSQRHRLRDHVLLSASDIKKGRVATYLAEQRVPCCPTKRKLKPDRPGEGSVRTLAEVRTLVAEAAAGGAGKKKAFDPEAPMLGWYSFFVMGKPLLLDAARAFQRAPHVRASATAVARSLFGGEPYLAVHLRREATQLGCSKGSPSVLCPLNGSEWTIDTAAVESQIRRAATAAAVTHVYIATIWPPQHRKYDGELPRLLQGVSGAASLSDSAAMSRALRASGTAGAASKGMTRYLQSLIEQELCATATAFLGSSRSTWTGNIQLQREAAGLGLTTFFGKGP